MELGLEGDNKRNLEKDKVFHCNLVIGIEVRGENKRDHQNDKVCLFMVI